MTVMATEFSASAIEKERDKQLSHCDGDDIDWNFNSGEMQK
jgi:hypothetical protein